MSGSSCEAVSSATTPRQGSRARPVPVIDDLDALATLVTCRPRIYLHYSDGLRYDELSGSNMHSLRLAVAPIAPKSGWTGSVTEWVAHRICSYPTNDENASGSLWLLPGQVTGRWRDGELILDMNRIRPIAEIASAVIYAARRVDAYCRHVPSRSRSHHHSVAD
ncbi:DUF6098 family protein [Phytoactinopolyspora endophytica]|uniref:DUF6098 family protein n=1 Tax=Phytoactinopolyspora endophytica TaxID=1642495 RepID=UPI003B835EBA